MPDRDRPSLNDLDARLKSAQARRGGRRQREADAEGRTDRGQGLGLALRIGTELVAGVAVGFGIGWGLDYWLGTKPWLMILFFFLGASAGMINVYRTMSGIGHGVGYKPHREDPAGADPDRPNRDGKPDNGV